MVDFFLLFFPRKKARKNPPKNPPQNSPRTLSGKIPLGFLQKPFLKSRRPGCCRESCAVREFTVVLQEAHARARARTLFASFIVLLRRSRTSTRHSNERRQTTSSGQTTSTMRLTHPDRSRCSFPWQPRCRGGKAQYRPSCCTRRNGKPKIAMFV